MSPSRRRKTGRATANPTARIMTRSIYKKQNQQKTEATKKETMSCGDDSSREICSTPKGDKYMIPKISTCPPAPVKKRLLLNCLSTSKPSSSAKFFAHPDLEVFFLFAPRDIHA